MSAWRDISSAPKAGLQRILVWRGECVEIAHWAVMVDEDSKPQGGWWWTDRLIKDRKPQPTHWQPLPDPPPPPTEGRDAR